MTSQMQDFHDFVGGATPEQSVYDLLLDHTKISFYRERVDAWKRGERIAPITMDVAWTRQCNAACVFCAAQFQANEADGKITKKIAFDFLEDAAEIGVKGISLISDGESTVVPWYEESIEYAAKLGLKVGIGSNGVRLKRKVLERILPHISYLRFNFSAGDRERYKQIMGLKDRDYDQVVQNVKDAMEIKRTNGLQTNINVQMVLRPEDADQIMPFARLAKEMAADYGIIKHCADDRLGTLGVDYRKYDALYPVLQEAEALSDEDFRMIVKWSRIQDEGKRNYHRCYGTPFLLQMSGSGLIAPCGQFFQEDQKKFHMGTILRERFRNIWASDRYWDVVNYLASDAFDATRCGPNCVQHLTNDWLDRHMGGLVDFAAGAMPVHPEFL